MFYILLLTISTGRGVRRGDSPVGVVDHEAAVATEEVGGQLPRGIAPELELERVAFRVHDRPDRLEAHPLVPRRAAVGR